MDFCNGLELLIYYKPKRVKVSSKKKRLAPVSAGILIAVILFAAFDILPIAISAINGIVLIVILCLVNPFKSYDTIDWKTIILIGGMYLLGIALNNNGAAEYFAKVLVNTLGEIRPIAVMSGIVFLTMLITQPIHNVAVSIIMTPLAINAAEIMGSDPVGFSVVVLVSIHIALRASRTYDGSGTRKI